jgi:hypothetical protein
MAIKPIRETYKGRKLLVKRCTREWGRLSTFINGEHIFNPLGITQEAAEQQMAQLKRDIDFADRWRAAGEADRFPAHWFAGAPEPTAEEIAEAAAWAERERADREALSA